MLSFQAITKKYFLFSIIVAVVIGTLIGQYLLQGDYWSGIYYPNGNSTGNAVYSPKFDTREECIGWAVNEMGKRPQDKEVSLQDLWECNKNCKLEENYKYLIRNNQRSILERNAGPLFVCDDGGFDGGDWLRGDF